VEKLLPMGAGRSFSVAMEARKRMKIRWEDMDMADDDYDPNDDAQMPQPRKVRVVWIVVIVCLIVTALGVWALILLP
jgi:hypothetical protein